MTGNSRAIGEADETGDYLERQNVTTDDRGSAARRPGLGGRWGRVRSTADAPTDFLQKPVRRKRLGQDRARCGDAQIGERRRGVAGHQDDWQLRMRSGEGLHQLDAIDSRHHDVRNHHIRRLATADQVECLSAVPGLNNEVALALEHPHRESADRTFVIYHENRYVGVGTQRYP